MYRGLSLTLVFVVGLLAQPVLAQEPIEVTPGLQLQPQDLGPSVIEDMSVVVTRDLEKATGQDPTPKGRNGAQGSWIVPTRGATYATRSGEHYLVNKWGDTRMGIGFPAAVNVEGAYFARQGNNGAATSGVRAIGYRAGQVVKTTDWFTRLTDQPQWLDMSMTDVDRVVIEAKAVLPDGSGWYSLDDLTYVTTAGLPRDASSRVIVDFEDCSYKQDLSGSKYAGLTWETGTGEFSAVQFVHPPQVPPGLEADATAEAEPVGEQFNLRAGTPPQLLEEFEAVSYGSAPGAWSYPPDTCGAAGPNHFGVVVNTNLSFFNKAWPYTRVFSADLGSFQPGTSGDPRILYDQHSGRWIVLSTNFSNRIYLAISASSNPLGSWFKTSFTVSSWPDFPTLGVDADGIYTSSYIVGSGGMNVWAIDKAPLLQSTPSLGTVTKFPSSGVFSFEYAIQPAHTYGTPGGEYFLSTAGSPTVRIRKLTGPLTAPTLTTVSNMNVGSYSSPPTAPALGSSVEIDTGDYRFNNTVMYRDGFVWGAHTVSYGGRSAARWYKLRVSPYYAVEDSGIVSDSSLYFYYPHIAVNARGDAVLGFTGSNSAQYAGAYYCGRLSTDPAGDMCTPVQFRAGVSSYQNVDGYGRNRWGDYSASSVDPADQNSFWSLQEYTDGTNAWGTHAVKLSYGDCNNNGVDDAADIAAGTSQDCNVDSVPDECQLLNNDCNANSVPDGCDIDALIVNDPADQGICPGGTAQFSVSVSQSPVSYQWKKDGIDLGNGGDISGTTDATLSIANVDATDAGGYTCAVADGCIVATSASATLTVLTAANVASQPTARLNKCEGADASFSVTAGGSAPFTYLWYENGVEIPGAISSTLTISAVTLAQDEFAYTCRVTNACGTALSNPGVLNVVYINFTDQPDDVCGATGSTVTTSTDALSGGGAIIWQWWKGASQVSGQSTRFLTLSNVQPANEGAYRARAIITSPTFCEEYSNPAIVLVGNCCATPGDLDGDGDFDLLDMSEFTLCFGPGGGLVPGCECANVKLDLARDVDNTDWEALEPLLNGPVPLP